MLLHATFFCKLPLWPCSRPLFFVCGCFEAFFTSPFLQVTASCPYSRTLFSKRPFQGCSPLIFPPGRLSAREKKKYLKNGITFFSTGNSPKDITFFYSKNGRSVLISPQSEKCFQRFQCVLIKCHFFFLKLKCFVTRL